MTSPLQQQPFQEDFPFSFVLSDEKGEAAIYIVSEEWIDKQRLLLKIQNTSGNPIYLRSLQSEEKPTPFAHHFQLRFRKGILSQASLGQSKSTDHLATMEAADVLVSRSDQKKPQGAGIWKMSAADPDFHKDYLSYYIGRMGKGSPWMFAPEATITLVLRSISAAPSLGTRETRVELLPGIMTLMAPIPPIHLPALYFNKKPEAGHSNDEDILAITRAREQTLRVINFLGEPYIPLHLGFAGPHTILNDNQRHDHQLELRITNTSVDKPIHFNENSRIHLNFDASEDPEQAGSISTRKNAESIRFFLGVNRSDYAEMDENAQKAREIQKDTTSQIGQESFKTITFQNLTDAANTVIPPKGAMVVLLDFKDFKTAHPAGVVFLHLHFENISGYWDRQLSVPIEITPLWIEKKHMARAGDFRDFNAVCKSHMRGSYFFFKEGRFWEIKDKEIIRDKRPVTELGFDSKNPINALFMTALWTKEDVFRVVYKDEIKSYKNGVSYKPGNPITLEKIRRAFPEIFQGENAHPNINAVASMINPDTNQPNSYHVYLFRGNTFWAITVDDWERIIVNDNIGPISISKLGFKEDFGPFDAVCGEKRKDGAYLLFFKGDKYWEVKVTRPMYVTGVTVEGEIVGGAKGNPISGFNKVELQLSSGSTPMFISGPGMKLSSGALHLNTSDTNSLSLDFNQEQPGLYSSAGLYLTSGNGRSTSLHLNNSNLTVKIGGEERLSLGDKNKLIGKLEANNLLIYEKVETKDLTVNGNAWVRGGLTVSGQFSASDASPQFRNLVIESVIGVGTSYRFELYGDKINWRKVTRDNFGTLQSEEKTELTYEEFKKLKKIIQLFPGL